MTEEDLLHVNTKMVNIENNTILTDSTLSKYQYLLLGEFSDSKFGKTQAEFLSQIDSRIDGLTIPDTTVISSTSTTTGILKTLLTELDPNFGDIISISSPTNIKADSAFFTIQYDNDFFGDSTSLQAVNIYALNKTLSTSEKYFTNTDASEFCNKDTLLGSISYQIQNSRKINVPLDIDFANKLIKIYQKGSSIKTQAQFNNFFKGIYASHSFNEGGIIKINLADIG